METPVNRKALIVTIAITSLIWVVILVAFARWNQVDRSGKTQDPALLHYPGTEQVKEQTSGNIGFRKYWFTLDEDYPSKSVYFFYRETLEGKGWKPLTENEPQWARTITGDGARDLFLAVWISPDHLFQLELQMMSTVKTRKEGRTITGEERRPGIEVYVTQRRVMDPGIMLEEEEEPSRMGGIE